MRPVPASVKKNADYHVEFFEPEFPFALIKEVFDRICSQTNKTPDTGNDDEDHENFTFGRNRVKVTIPYRGNRRNDKIKCIERGEMFQGHQPDHSRDQYCNKNARVNLKTENPLMHHEF